jgi:hypothetical protein
MIKALYRVVQLQHHARNWESIPASIHRNIGDLRDSITPADPTTATTEELDAIFNSMETAVRECMTRHLEERLEANRNILQNLNPEDKDAGKTVCKDQLVKRLGKKMDWWDRGTHTDHQQHQPANGVGRGRRHPQGRKDGPLE